MKIQQTAGRVNLGEFAPDFAAYNDDVLFGKVWSTDGKLTLRDRSLITVVTLMAQGLTDNALLFHLQTAKANGITKEEIAEIITHAAFYAGWPKAWATFGLAKQVCTEPSEEATTTTAQAAKAAAEGKADEAKALTLKAAHEAETLFPVGEFNSGYAKYFSGDSFLYPVSTSQVGIYNVTFEPGCRNNWHVHEAKAGGGQILVVISGEGYYQEFGKPAQRLKAGDVVNIPAGVKHWHGAAKDTWFSHLAVEVPGTETANTWLEPVSDEDYNKLP